MVGGETSLFGKPELNLGILMDLGVRISLKTKLTRRYLDVIGFHYVVTSLELGNECRVLFARGIPRELFSMVVMWVY